MIVDAWRNGGDWEELVRLIFQAYEDHRFFDVLIAQALDGIAKGTLGLHPKTLKDLTNENGEPTRRYNLYNVTEIQTGRDTAKALGRWRNSYALLEGIPIEQWPLDALQYPVDDACNTREVADLQLTNCENLHDVAFQCYTDFCLKLGAAWSFVTDKAAVDALEAKTLDGRVEDAQPFLAAGFIREGKEKDYSENQGTVRRATALAYGCGGQCQICLGTGMVGTTSKCTRCKASPGVDPKGGTCTKCNGCGRVPAKKGKNCVACGATGLDIKSAPVPMTDPSDKFPQGQIQIGRDALIESGDDQLIEYAEFKELDKLGSTYIPWLRGGHDEDGNPRPIRLSPNALVDTGRTSYGVEHQLPRGMGVRECIRARDGWVFYSVDWGGVELVTHAQSCLWLLGHSRLAEVINQHGAGAVHAAFGAKLAGIPFEQFDKKKHGAYRQCAKAANFGFPGGMGAVKLVLQQRKGGPDTTGPDGRVYKGLRFCILIGGSDRCGVEKITEWKERPTTPVCKRCVEVADKLRDEWFEQWPENREYFRFVFELVDRNGHVVSHVDKRKRGGVWFTNACNGFFQSLAAYAAKLSLQRVSKEQWCDRQSAMYGARNIYVVHDELFGTCRKEVGHEVAHRVSEIMIATLREVCPDIRNVEAPPALMARWFKEAEAVYGPDGRLVPWEPEVK
jgi:DNA polymerase-1